MEEKKVEELFGGIPKWVEFFKGLEKGIENYRYRRWKENTTKEKLMWKHDELLQFAQELEEKDLTLLYCLHHFKCTNFFCLYRTLRKFYIAQCDFFNKQNPLEPCENIFEIGPKI